MTGETNVTIPRDEIVNISLKTNQSSHSDLIGVIVTVSYSQKTIQTTWDGTDFVVKVPASVNYTISFSAVNGYSTPSSVSYTSIANNSRALSFTYQTTVVTASIKSNQSSTTDIANATLAIAGVSLKNGESVKIATGTKITPSWSSVSGYASPDNTSSVTLSGSSYSVEGIYKTSVVTVTLADNQTSYNDISSAKATVSGAVSATLSSGGSVKVPWGSTISVSGSSVSGYKTPSSVSYIASSATKSITLTWACEILTVTVSSDKNTPSGYTITVVNASSGATIGSQTSSSKTYKIPANTSYYVKASSINGFTAPSNSSTVTASSSSNAKNSITMKYISHPGTTSPSNGVYIHATNGYFYTVNEWDGSKTANGVAVVTSNCRFAIALADCGRDKFGGYNVDVEDVTDTTSGSWIKTRYDGLGETITLINSLSGTNDGYVDGAPAAELCRGYRFPNGSYGYLGAGGEWQAALDNSSAVNEALSKCGGSTLSDQYWVCAQYGAQFAWHTIDSSRMTADYRYRVKYVRAFCSV